MWLTMKLKATGSPRRVLHSSGSLKPGMVAPRSAPLSVESRQGPREKLLSCPGGLRRLQRRRHYHRSLQNRTVPGIPLLGRSKRPSVVCSGRPGALSAFEPQRPPESGDLCRTWREAAVPAPGAQRGPQQNLVKARANAARGSSALCQPGNPQLRRAKPQPPSEPDPRRGPQASHLWGGRRGSRLPASVTKQKPVRPPRKRQLRSQPGAEGSLRHTLGRLQSRGRATSDSSL